MNLIEKLYKKKNPSYLGIKKIQIKRRTDLIQRLLNFPLRFFKGIEVGDIACGTGEFAIIAAKNAAKVKGYDFNSIAIDAAKQKCKKLKIKNASFFVKEFLVCLTHLVQKVEKKNLLNCRF